MRSARAQLAAVCVACLQVAACQTPIRLDSLQGLELRSIQEDGVDPVKTDVKIASYRGRRALRVVNDDGLTASGTSAGAQAIATIAASNLTNGSIDVDVVGLPREGAPPSTRGFVGVAFHVQSDRTHYESLYLRQINGRSSDQLQRNHTTQYISQPQNDTPGMYESYVDVEPGAWTHLKIMIAGSKASLFVNGSAQPCLVVNDLKLGADISGQVALWTGSNTEAYFSNLRIAKQ